MASKDPTSSTAVNAPPFLNWGREQTNAALGLQIDLQKTFLDSCERASRDWPARAQSELTLWSDLANKLTTSRTVPEAVETYTKCVSRRMQMAADDGRRLVDESQQITQKIAKSLGDSWPTGAST